MDGMDWIILLLGCAGLILGMASLLRRRPAENFSVELTGWKRTAAGGRPAVALCLRLQNHATAPLTLLAFEWDGTRWELPVTVGPRAAREVAAVFPLPEEGFPEPGAEVALTVETLSGSSRRRLRLAER